MGELQSARIFSRYSAIWFWRDWGKFSQKVEKTINFPALLIWYSFDEQVSRNIREFLAENTQKLYHVSNANFPVRIAKKIGITHCYKTIYEFSKNCPKFFILGY